AGGAAEAPSPSATQDTKPTELARATVGAGAGETKAPRRGKPATARDGRSTNGAGPSGPTPPAPTEGFRRTRQYSPVVLKLAAEHNTDLALVRGTGIEGRVTRQDVLAYIENPTMHMVPPGEGEGVVGVSQKERAREAPPRQRAPAEAPPAAAEPET